MKAPVSGGERIDQTKVIPEGKHVAILYSIIDLWTQEKNGMYGMQFRRTVQLTFELPKVTHEFKKGEGEKPAAVRAKVKLSMHEKSELRKIVQNLLGKQFTDEQARDFDLSDLLGLMCQLQVVHQSYEGTNYVKITNYINLTDEEKEFHKSKGVEQFNPSLLFSLDEYDQATFDSLPQFLKDMIVHSPEYNEIKHWVDRTEEELVDELEWAALAVKDLNNDPVKRDDVSDLPF